MEDLSLYLKDVLTERPHTSVPSSDTVLRGIEGAGNGEYIIHSRGLQPVCKHTNALGGLGQLSGIAKPKEEIDI